MAQLCVECSPGGSRPQKSVHFNDAIRFELEADDLCTSWELVEEKEADDMPPGNWIEGHQARVDITRVEELTYFPTDRYHDQLTM